MTDGAGPNHGGAPAPQLSISTVRNWVDRVSDKKAHVSEERAVAVVRHKVVEKQVGKRHPLA